VQFVVFIECFSCEWLVGGDKALIMKVLSVHKWLMSYHAAQGMHTLGSYATSCSGRSGGVGGTDQTWDMLMFFFL